MHNVKQEPIVNSVDETNHSDEPYALDKLMQETRRLAAEYHKATGTALPVTTELARFDVMRLLGFNEPPNNLSGVDAIGSDEFADLRVQIKGRVIFSEAKSNARLGHFNTDAAWDMVVLVIYDQDYQPVELYGIKREALLQELNQSSDSARARKRGQMSVAKFKALGQCLYSSD